MKAELEKLERKLQDEQTIERQEHARSEKLREESEK